jgi:hypothetical protein
MTTPIITYVLYGLGAAYLIFGAILTHSMLAAMHRRRHPLRDWVLGTIGMPVLFFIGVIFMACEKLWARLLPLLAFEKPEVMRAGPETAPQRKDAR